MPPKKEEKKPATDHFPSFVLFLFVLYFLGMVAYRFELYLHDAAVGTYESLWASVVAFMVHRFWPIVKIIAFIASGAAVVGLVIFVGKLRKITEEEAKLYHDAEDKGSEAPSVQRNEKWEKVVTHINSTNAAEWRLAIIEADILLDELLRACGYHGDSIGDMLKGVEKSDMLTLDAAWEAHKVRNRIAHDGADFELTERDAKRVITLYEVVFKEFKII